MGFSLKGTFTGNRPLGATTRLPVGTIATALYVAFICLPILALLVKVVQQDNALASVVDAQVLQALRLSLLTSAISMVVVVVVGTPFALHLARSESMVMRVVDQIVELPIILPPVVAGVAMLLAFGRQGILGGTLASAGINLPFTTTAVVFAQVFVAAPFYIRSAKLGFQAVPDDFEDISRTLGVSPWRTFWRLTLPLAAPSLLGGLSLAWARAISEFGATIMFAGNLPGRTQTMPLAILTALESDLGSALALSAMLLAGSALVLVALGVAARRNWQGRL